MRVRKSAYLAVARLGVILDNLREPLAQHIYEGLTKAGLEAHIMPVDTTE